MTGREFLALEPESMKEYLLSRKFGRFELYGGLGLTGMRVWESGRVMKKGRPIFHLYINNPLQPDEFSKYQAKIESAEVVVEISFVVKRDPFLILEGSDLEMVDIKKYNK